MDLPEALHLHPKDSWLIKNHPALELAAWGALLELALLAFWAFSGVWRGSWRLMAGFLLPGAVYCMVAWWAMRPHPLPASRRTCAVLLGFAALFHLTLLFTPFPLTNDLYRYSWDGKLLVNGINPYTYPPAAPELAAYRDASWELIFNRDVPTGYPPLAEAMFAAAYRLSPNVWVLRGMAALASLGTTALLMLSLGVAGMDGKRALIFGWSPLVALEFANSGHLDAFAIFFMSAGLLLALKRRSMGAAVSLALGGLVKFFPVVLLPLWGRRWGKTVWLIFVLAFALPWLPFLAGGTPFKGLGIFAVRGDFNGSLYRLIERLWFLVADPAYASFAARLTVLAILALFCLAYLPRWRDRSDVLSGWRFAGALFGLSLVLSPVVHPWYVCWMLAFIAVGIPTNFSPAAWLVLSVTMIFARDVYIGYEQTGVWQEAWWPPLAVWIPFYLAAAGSVWSGWKAANRLLGDKTLDSGYNGILA